MAMNASQLDKHMAALDDVGATFAASIAKFNEVKDDPSKAKIGGEIDTALAQAIKAAHVFASLLKELEQARLPTFGGSDLKRKREKILAHSRKNLHYMNAAIDAVPKTFRDVAETTTAMDMLKDRMS